MSGSDPQTSLGGIPLFPLPNVVLFPRAVLPLHIFEDRYKQMTADVLDGDRRIAMALYKPGWEKCPQARPPVEPVVCVGQILTWEQLADGNYNFLLQGRQRARIIHEHIAQPYRVADLEILQETATLEIDLEHHRHQMALLFGNGGLATLPVAAQFREMLTGPLPTADIADLAAFTLLEDVYQKQDLLAQVDVRRRVEQVIEALGECASQINPGLHGCPVDPSIN